MRDENVRVREKFELSLDGRQIASIVVGALVILGVVFVLGLNVGRQIVARQVEAARAGDLEALDRVPVAAAAPAKDDLTFYDKLPKGKPAPPPPEPVRPVPSAPAPSATAQAPAAPPAAPSTATSAPAPAPAAPSPASAALAAIAAPSTAAAPAPKPAATAAKPGAPGAFVVQLAATQSRAEAERLAARYHALSPRIEVADVAGKGRFYRVRAGSFATRAEAERYLAQASRQSGAKGFVTAGR